ncbi:multidrug efflux SMR transporter [Luteococcus peritonei]|uniref:Multidrug efflux SMR transporter n=1 Tax=Luteococcus peritonei TaxID=88874 RepID=A0ABW4RTL7_9ACTN
MAWLILILSGTFEAVWATALDRIEGLSRPLPIVVFLAAMTVSMVGLAHGMRQIPVGTAYAVWVGVGAVTTLGWSMATGNESVSVVKILLVLGIVGCVAGLKLVGEH